MASFLDKLCAGADLPARVAALPRKLVFTNGVFDILHRGHVNWHLRGIELGAHEAAPLVDEAKSAAQEMGEHLKPQAQEAMAARDLVAKRKAMSKANRPLSPWLPAKVFR
mgnify:CR=1 FL=1